MTKNEQEQFRIAWLRKKSPDDVEKISRLNQALGHIERAGDASLLSFMLVTPFIKTMFGSSVEPSTKSDVVL
jgi:hypothetical protein